MVVIGITGGIGSGKGLATEFFRSRGAVILDADEVSRELAAPGSPMLQKIVAAFGEEFLRADGTLDRRRFAEHVFADRARAARLNSITHPHIMAEIQRRLAQLRTSYASDPAHAAAVVCLVAPLLLEAGGRSAVDRVLVVAASEPERVRRVMERDGLSEEAVRQRMSLQMPAEEQVRQADWVVDTTAGKEAALRRLEEVWGEVAEMARLDVGGGGPQRREAPLPEGAALPRRVCMFVYNNMLHDARVRKEARTLSEAGYEVTVLAVREPGPTLREETVHGFRILRISRPRPPALKVLDTATRLPLYPLRRVVVFVRFLRAALRTKADVYHAHDLNTLLMAWTASRLRRVPLIYDTHEVETARAGTKLRWWACFLERALIHRADRVICTNQTRAAYTQRRYGIPPPTILRNLPAYIEPPPSKLIHERLHLPSEAKVVLYQGGIQPERGLEQLLSAAPLIQGGLVVLVGSGRLKPALQQQARAQGLQDRVFFHDAVPVDELPRWTASAYLGLQILQNTCFNHYSSLSNKLLEYLMAGIPVIASDLPEMRRVIEDTGAGLLIDSSDPRQIADAANRLLADEGLREVMSEKAKAARRRYSWEEGEDVLRELYAGLVE